MDCTAKWSTLVRTKRSGNVAVSYDTVAVRRVFPETVRTASRLRMYPAGMVLVESDPIVTMTSAGVTPIFWVVLTVPMLVFAPQGATENKVVARVVPESAVEADIQR